MSLDPISAGIGLVDTVVSRIWPDPSETQKAQIEAFKVAMKSEMAIHATNTAEAQHPSMFVAGWRPAIGWTCALGIAYTFLFQPLLAWVSMQFDMDPPPILGVDTLIALATTMLGVSGMRAMEGIKGVKRSTWRP